MKRSGPLERKSPMRRGTFKRRPPSNPVPKEVYDAVIAAAGGKCPRCGDPKPLTFHHRIKRSQGGKHTVENGVALCQTCHDWVEDNPAAAVKEGWSIQRKAVV